MEKNKILLMSLVISAIAGTSIIATSMFNEESVHPMQELGYTPSDISKAFPQLDGVKQGEASWSTTNIKDVKNEVQYSIRGNVVSIGQGEDWTDPTSRPENYDSIFGKNVKIPINIEVLEIKKTKSDVKVGDIITVTLTGKLLEKTLYLDGGEPQFEVSEEVIVHIATDPNDIIGKDTKYVKLGEYGKYKIEGDKAFNSKYIQGKNIAEALNETQ